jgi:hypothetical protein
MKEANFYQVDIDENNLKIIAGYETLSISNYPDLFKYHRSQGMTKAELADLFLWTAHSYPGQWSWGFDKADSVDQ